MTSYRQAAGRADVDDDDLTPSTWLAVDLGPTPSPDATSTRPTMFTRTDGTGLLYPGRVHWFQGESESLKSWAAQAATVEVLAAGGNVLYIDYEDDDRGIVARLLALGVDKDVLADPARFRYLRPDEPLARRQGHRRPPHGRARTPPRAPVAAGRRRRCHRGDDHRRAAADRQHRRRHLAAPPPATPRRHRRRRRLRRPRRQERRRPAATPSAASTSSPASPAPPTSSPSPTAAPALTDPTTGRVHDHRREGPARLGAGPRRGRRRHHRRVRGHRLARRRRHRRPARPRRRRRPHPSGRCSSRSSATSTLRRRVQERSRRTSPGRAEAVRAALTWLVQQQWLAVTKVGQLTPALAHRPRPRPVRRTPHERVPMRRTHSFAATASTCTLLCRVHASHIDAWDAGRIQKTNASDAVGRMDAFAETS